MLEGMAESCSKGGWNPMLERIAESYAQRIGRILCSKNWQNPMLNEGLCEQWSEMENQGEYVAQLIQMTQNILV